MSPTEPPQHVRLYHQVRSAHLERAAVLPDARILYASRRYDFEEGLAAGLDLVPARGARAAWYLVRHQVDVLEVNEPLYVHGARWTALALTGLRIGQLLRRRRCTVVTYAIENLDPTRSRARTGLRSRLGRRLDTMSMRVVWQRLDRIAFGTKASQDLYSSLLRPRGDLRSKLVVALPSAAPDARPGSKVPRSALFLGALSARKGFPDVVAAWPEVSGRLPDARLTIVGQGALEPMALELARRVPTATVLVDPPRDTIRALLQTHAVVVLPSQPTPGWKEQVGLPLVEGLSYGCTIVTTTETGLADWLLAVGHRVISPSGGTSALVDALVDALAQPLEPHAVLASLPPADGRLVADRWLSEHLDPRTEDQNGPAPRTKDTVDAD